MLFENHVYVMSNRGRLSGFSVILVLGGAQVLQWIGEGAVYSAGCGLANCRMMTRGLGAREQVDMLNGNEP